MSRSYKHFPCCTGYDYGNGKLTKKFAARNVRNYSGEIPNGCFYKRLYNGYVIEYQFYDTKKSWIRRYEKMVMNYPHYAIRETLEESMNSWYKYYYRK